MNQKTPSNNSSKSKIDPDLWPIMVKVTGGSFEMGEKDPQRVEVKDFWMGKYPVTNRQYLAFMLDYESDKVKAGSYAGQEMLESNRWGLQKENGRWKVAEAYEQHPIIGVSWYGAVTYCEWLSEQTEQHYRLPSEAEWEYAARGGGLSKGFIYAGSNNLKEVGWYEKNSHYETKAVGLKMENELGLYDMSGNVDEWCSDVRTIDEEERVVRGGSWNDYDDFCRVSYRFRYIARFWDDDLGFRVSRY